MSVKNTDPNLKKARTFFSGLFYALPILSMYTFAKNKLMTPSNFERMIQMAEEVFDAHNDPEQLDVDEQVIARLHQLHQACVSELDEGTGPVVWILLIPTTAQLMHDFLNGQCSEKELLNRTPVGGPYQAIYLCSAMVLPEYRNKGIAKKLTLNAIASIQKTHPIEALFVWPFSKEGEKLSEKIAEQTGIKLSKKRK